MMSERRILIGLIGLLFVMGFIHTMGILNLSKKLSRNVAVSSQKAQVATIGTCLNVSPLYNIDEPNEVYVNNTFPGNVTHMYLSIKNSCTSTINIFNAGVGYTTPTLTDLQTRQADGNPATISASQFNNYNINNYSEFVECFNCGNSILQYPSSVPGTPSTIYVHPIPAGQKRTIIYNVSYGMTSVPELPIRVAPKAIKWVAQNSLTDGQLSTGEIITSTIPSASMSSWATDFIEASYQ